MLHSQAPTQESWKHEAAISKQTHPVCTSEGMFLVHNLPPTLFVPLLTVPHSNSQE